MFVSGVCHKAEEQRKIIDARVEHSSNPIECDFSVTPVCFGFGFGFVSRGT